MNTTVAILGSTGFIGRAVEERLLADGIHPRCIQAPRLVTRENTAAGLAEELSRHKDTINALCQLLQGCEVVINAAGAASPTSVRSDQLYGANALLPGLVALAAQEVQVARMVHVSSAAVQGRRPYLDETAAVEPFSSYSRSKALGEALLCLVAPRDTCIFRPTSVHAISRSITRSLIKLAASRVPLLIASGEHPTPQVHIDNVAEAVLFLTDLERDVPQFVLQPWEGFTTRSFISVLSAVPPRVVPQALCRASLIAARGLSHTGWPQAGLVRRAEMLLIGQRQTPGWLMSNGFRLAAGKAQWSAMVHSVLCHA